MGCCTGSRIVRGVRGQLEARDHWPHRVRSQGIPSLYPSKPVAPSLRALFASSQVTNCEHASFLPAQARLRSRCPGECSLACPWGATSRWPRRLGACPRCVDEGACSGPLPILASAGHLLGEQPPIAAVPTQFGSVQSGGLKHHLELVGGAPTLRILLGGCSSEDDTPLNCAPGGLVLLLEQFKPDTL
jgi:hypothetical protein